MPRQGNSGSSGWLMARLKRLLSAKTWFWSSVDGSSLKNRVSLIVLRDGVCSFIEQKKQSGFLHVCGGSWCGSESMEDSNGEGKRGF